MVLTLARPPLPLQARFRAAWTSTASRLRARRPPRPAPPPPSWPPASGSWRSRGPRPPPPSSAPPPARCQRRLAHPARRAALSCLAAARCRPSPPSRCLRCWPAWRWARWWGRAPLAACTAASGRTAWWPSRSSTAHTPPRQAQGDARAAAGRPSAVCPCSCLAGACAAQGGSGMAAIGDPGGLATMPVLYATTHARRTPPAAVPAGGLIGRCRGSAGGGGAVQEPQASVHRGGAAGRGRGRGRVQCW